MGGCAGVWVCRYADVQMCGCVIDRFENGMIWHVWDAKDMVTPSADKLREEEEDVQMCKCADMRTCKYFNLQ